MQTNPELSPEPIFDALNRADRLARTGELGAQWRQLRLEAETLAAQRARTARAHARPAPVTTGPARTEWSQSERLASSARVLAVNIASENRRRGITPEPTTTAPSPAAPPDERGRRPQ